MKRVICLYRVSTTGQVDKNDIIMGQRFDAIALDHPNRNDVVL